MRCKGTVKSGKVGKFDDLRCVLREGHDGGHWNGPATFVGNNPVRA